MLFVESLGGTLEAKFLLRAIYIFGFLQQDFYWIISKEVLLPICESHQDVEIL